MSFLAGIAALSSYCAEAYPPTNLRDGVICFDEMRVVESCFAYLFVLAINKLGLHA